MSHHQEADFARHISIGFILPGRGTHADEQQDVPRKSDFKEHLKIQDAKQSRIQLCTHKEVVDRIPGDAMLCTTSEGREVGNEREDKTSDDGHTHQRAKFIDDRVQLENARNMEAKGHSDRRVERRDGGTTIRQLFTSQVLQRSAFDFDSGQIQVAGGLEDEESPVDCPRFQ